MTAALYIRKSTEQNGVSDDQKSVARQEEHARQYAQAKGWAVADEHVYVDDGISGAEFANRPGFLRLMNALKPRPPFQVLVMSEESRLGREAIETAYALKQLVLAGVRVFFYLEDRERTLDSPTDKIMLSLTAFADELEREKARQRTYDAMVRKARAGHVCGGAVFGYENFEVLDANGRRSHVERRILEEEAAVVRRIFRMCADGYGLTTIAKTLNAERVRCPRSQQGRPNGWAPSSIREVLYRELYHGQIVWNKTRKRDQWGLQRQRARLQAEWLRVPAPQLQIVPDELWETVHELLAATKRRYLRLNDGKLLGRAPGTTTSRYLLSGLLTCGLCGSSLEGRTRSHGRVRAPFYGCAAHKRKGSTVCRNNYEIPMKDADEAVLSTIEHVMLDPAVLQDVITEALTEIAADVTAGPDAREVLTRELADVEQELARLGDALAAGGNLSTILAGIRAREQRRLELQRAVDKAGKPLGQATDPKGLLAKMETRVKDWRGLLRGYPEQGQQLLRRLIVGRLALTPERDEKGRYYRFTGQGTWSRLLDGIVPRMRPLSVASPICASWNQMAGWLRAVEGLRRAA